MTNEIKVSRHFQSKHYQQNGNGLDERRDDANDGRADGGLRANHVVVQTAHQFTDLGVNEETQRHTLQAGIEGHAQVISHALTYIGTHAALKSH